ncbi:hypothetical protein BC829DRAFT_405318 [Chytridium lagenaria]|nr:hypothetical protein BC829DRAFT_405318 [Chytridium lagenaria]
MSPPSKDVVVAANAVHGAGINLLAPLAQEHEECEQILLMTQMLMSMANSKPSAPPANPSPSTLVPSTTPIMISHLSQAFHLRSPLFSLPAETLSPSAQHDSYSREDSYRGASDSGLDLPDAVTTKLIRDSSEEGAEPPSLTEPRCAREAAARAFITPITTTVNTAAPSPDADLMLLSRYAESELASSSSDGNLGTGEFTPTSSQDDEDEDVYERQRSPISGFNALVKVAEEILGNNSASPESFYHDYSDDASGQSSTLTQNSLPINVVGTLPTMQMNMDSQFVGSPQNSYNMQYWQQFARQGHQGSPPHIVQQPYFPAHCSNMQTDTQTIKIPSAVAPRAPTLRTPTTPSAYSSFDGRLNNAYEDRQMPGMTSSFPYVNGYHSHFHHSGPCADEGCIQPLTAPLTPLQSSLTVGNPIDLAAAAAVASLGGSTFSNNPVYGSSHHKYQPLSESELTADGAGTSGKTPPSDFHSSSSLETVDEEGEGGSDGPEKKKGDGSKKSLGAGGIKARPNFPPDVLKMLTGWLNANLGHPYPPQEVKHQLAKDTGLKLKQVNDWFINARRRRLS